MERFNLNKLNEVMGKEQYHVEISSREFTGINFIQTLIEYPSLKMKFTYN
jgi:hypothetical protein